MSDQPELPAILTLPALQGYVREIVKARGFTTEINEIFILLVEEVGELASELVAGEGAGRKEDHENLALELADILLYLVDIANGYDVDMASHWGREPSGESRIESAENGNPFPRLSEIADCRLNDFMPHSYSQPLGEIPQEAPGEILAVLVRAMGALAHEIRRSWKFPVRQDAIAEGVVAALAAVLRMGAVLGVDMERAVREKEVRNAVRSWDY